jgi:hypothetical protein
MAENTGKKQNRKNAKPAIAQGTTRAAANAAIIAAGHVVGTVVTTATQDVNLNDKVVTALTDTSVVLLGTAINYDYGVFSPPGFFAPPDFFSPPNFFSPPGFFAPPGFPSVICVKGECSCCVPC